MSLDVESVHLRSEIYISIVNGNSDRDGDAGQQFLENSSIQSEGHLGGVYRLIHDMIVLIRVRQIHTTGWLVVSTNVQIRSQGLLHNVTG